MDAGLAEPVHGARHVGDLEGEPVPTSRRGQSAGGHCLPSAWSIAGCAEQETKVAASQHGEGRSGMHPFLEAEVLAS